MYRAKPCTGTYGSENEADWAVAPRQCCSVNTLAKMGGQGKGIIV